MKYFYKQKSKTLLFEMSSTENFNYLRILLSILFIIIRIEVLNKRIAAVNNNNNNNN
jgi:hypothetical protein